MKHTQTKQQILKNIVALESLATHENGLYLDTDGICGDLDGKHMSEYLAEIGYEVLSYRDTGRNGFVRLACGIAVSTNGFACMLKPS